MGAGSTDIGLMGFGMVTSVGHDAATACVSIAAGLQRTATLPYHEVLDFDAQESRPLVGRPVQVLTNGFAGAGRWLRLASLAMGDLQRRASFPDPTDAAFWSRTVLCAVLPENDPQRFWLDEGIAYPALDQMLGPILDAIGWPIAAQRRIVLRDGHAGMARAIQAGMATLRAGTIDRILLLCADSCVDADSLSWLDEADRLKLEDQPFGVIPGEAAACIWLEPHGSREDAIDAGFSIRSATFNSGVASFHSGKPLLGHATAHAMSQALSECGVEQFDGLVIADLNGEPWRAQELASARMRLKSRLADEIEWCLPAESLGEVGAASAGVGLCLAAMSLRRSASHTRHAVVVSLSESGAAGCIVLGTALN